MTAMISGEIVDASGRVFAADGLSLFLSPSLPRRSFSAFLELSAMTGEIVDGGVVKRMSM
ncbi:hypothetical protein TIFTF001_023693 [Ficus carica]|uniref:Uncharacterized protein n=1 Tax=Ficus carica TaxID=3494 RepID=A0AA88AKX0_FICCA|nr:hypothetical protein TIFTF001_023693 [Ficus carica]